MPSAQPPSRRDLFRIGMTGVLGLPLPSLLAAAEKARPGRARNVLVILEQGGLSHIDTWDPKPNAVAEHRSAYKPIATKVPGLRFTELLTETAKVADKLTVVRSMHHPKAGASGHPEGTQYMLSGAHPSSATRMPDIGSVVSRVLGTTNPALPPYVMVPGNDEQSAQTSTGFLPASTGVFKTGGRDLAAPDWKVGALEPRTDTSTERLANRRELLSGMNEPAGGLNQFYAQAFDTLTSPRVAKAFDYRGEPERVRDRYGKGHRGACYLVGRKLIEAGVRFVTVDTRWPLQPDLPGGFNLNWDHHDLIYAPGSCGTIRDKAGGEGRYGIGHWVMMGSTDRAFAALIADLDDRGLLAETLVCFVTEFGRTPKLNKFQGRDHWPDAYSIAFAGAGVPGGQVIGATDRDGGQVVSDPYTPEAYAATIYEKLGIDRSKPLYTASNRPVFIGHDADPMAQLF
ncbi:MAG TPA: DUF1501 domain-containing protein [Gemmataceae bacterium]|jgi:hypothetical protein|nr:DUF1501 domain-containing protein [Gemmataceae bacterium]